MSQTSLSQFSAFSANEITNIYETYDRIISGAEKHIADAEKNIKMQSMLQELMNQDMISSDKIKESLDKNEDLFKQLREAIDKAKKDIVEYVVIKNKLKELKDLVTV